MKKKYFCRNCKGLRNQRIIFEHKVRGQEEHYYQWIEQYKIIECEGCETVSFLEIYSDSTMIRNIGENDFDYYENEKIFPLYLEKGTEIRYHHLPSAIKDIYIETISAFKSGALILTAGGFRAIIEALCNNLKIKKGNLEERINLLHEKGHLTLIESKRLHSIRFLGNDALHEIEKPSKEQLNVLFEIVNHLLSNLFINDKIIKGQIDTIIDEYSDFIKLIQSRVTKDMLNSEFKIDEFLGKSKRLINKSNLKKFIDNLNKEIQNNEITYLQILNEESFLYKVTGEPEFSFYWDE